MCFRILHKFDSVNHDIFEKVQENTFTRTNRINLKDEQLTWEKVSLQINALVTEVSDVKR